MRAFKSILLLRMHTGECNLDECFLCRHCLPEWKELIKLHKRTILIKKGKRLFEEGDKVKSMFFLIKGAFKIHIHWGDQKELIIRFVVPGDPLGIRGLVASGVYPITATALEDSWICVIDNDFLETTLRVNHALTYQLMHFYAAELHHAEKRMRNLAHMEVKGRIADALMEMKNAFGVNEQHQLRFSITRQDIASYAGTTYETVFKLFNEMTADGIIAASGKTISILKPEALRKMASRKSA